MGVLTVAMGETVPLRGYTTENSRQLSYLNLPLVNGLGVNVLTVVFLVQVIGILGLLLERDGYPAVLQDQEHRDLNYLKLQTL